jgi:uncharacterized protein involved in exopolysaccharide biosynthesis
MSNKQEEIQLKEIFLKIGELKKEVYSYIFQIICFIILIVSISAVSTYIRDAKYKSELTFVVEDKQQSSPLSSMTGLASQFGLDMFSNSNSTFSQKNIMELLKSRGVISKALMQTAYINNKQDLFIHHYLTIYNLTEEWNNDNKLKNLNFNDRLTVTHDSITALIWDNIIENDLFVNIKNDETDIIYLSFYCKNELFAKLFSESLIYEMSRMYISYQTKQSSNTIEFLQNRADSVFLELQVSEQEFARIKDINQRIIKASGRLKELQLMRNVEVLNTMYLELVKNLEISKMTLLNQTPIIQVIDKPILPLENTKISIALVMMISFVLALLLSILYIVLRKLVNDSLN